MNHLPKWIRNSEKYFFVHTVMIFYIRFVTVSTQTTKNKTNDTIMNFKREKRIHKRHIPFGKKNLLRITLFNKK